MKKLSDLVNNSSEKPQVKLFDLQEDTVGYLDKNLLEKFLEITNNFISDEAKEIIKFLIDNNEDYKNNFKTDKHENPLASFYLSSKPKTEEEKKLFKNIGILYKRSRLLEIPVFLTKEQVESIINKTETPDSILLDLNTPKGRNEVSKKYDSLVYKIARQYHGKSNLEFNDLLSAGRMGLIYAMNNYGKKTKHNKADLEQITSTTFTQYAAYWIRVLIIDDIRKYGNTVRIPVNQQGIERKETGKNTKSNTISGDKGIEQDNSNSKSLFDLVGGANDTGRSLDEKDVKRLWDAVYKKLEKVFDKTMMEIFYYSNGLNDHEKLKKKEIADKFNIAPSSISYYLWKINTYMTENKEILNALKNINDFMQECQNDIDSDFTNDEILSVNEIYIKTEEE